MSSNSFIKWYGILPDYSVKHYQTDKDAYADGCPYTIREYGYIYVYGNWTNHRHYSYQFFKKDSPYSPSLLDINGWLGEVKQLDSHSQLITFRIYGKHTVWREFTTTKFIEGVVMGINKLKEISVFQDWNHFDLHNKAAEQDKGIKDLEAKVALLTEENKQLKKFHDTIYLQRGKIQQLYKTLYASEIKEGTQHL